MGYAQGGPHRPVPPTWCPSASSARCSTASRPPVRPGWARAAPAAAHRHWRRKPVGSLAAVLLGCSASWWRRRQRRASAGRQAVAQARQLQQSKGEDGLLGVAERYSSEDWWQHCLDLPYSRILHRISSHLTFNTILAIAVCAYQHFFHGLTVFPATPLILCSTALGLLLVFRTTAAYERWQLGQRHAYDLRHHLQQILRVMRPWLSQQRFCALQSEVCAFPRTIGVHLSALPGAGFIYGIGPRDLMTQISDGLAVHFSGAEVPVAAIYAHDRVQGHINEVLLRVGDMERLATEAVPRDYSRHTSRFLTVWMCSLPFVLIECGNLMPLTVMIISWALLSIEEIGHGLEDPFNSPTQPVPVQAILESGGGEHSLATRNPNEAPAAEPLWERRVSWAEDP